MRSIFVLAALLSTLSFAQVANNGYFGSSGGGGGGSGDIVGPSSSLDGQVPTFSGTTGKLLTNSPATIGSGGGTTTFTTSDTDLVLSAATTVTVNSTTATTNAATINLFPGSSVGVIITDSGGGTTQLGTNNTSLTVTASSSVTVGAGGGGANFGAPGITVYGTAVVNGNALYFGPDSGTATSSFIDNGSGALVISAAGTFIQNAADTYTLNSQNVVNINSAVNSIILTANAGAGNITLNGNPGIPANNIMNFGADATLYSNGTGALIITGTLELPGNSIFLGPAGAQTSSIQDDGSGNVTIGGASLISNMPFSITGAAQSLTFGGGSSLIDNGSGVLNMASVGDMTITSGGGLSLLGGGGAGGLVAYPDGSSAATGAFSFAAVGTGAGTAPVADGTYTVGIGSTNGTITTVNGVITAVQEAVP